MTCGDAVVIVREKTTDPRGAAGREAEAGAGREVEIDAVNVRGANLGEHIGQGVVITTDIDAGQDLHHEIVAAREIIVGADHKSVLLDMEQIDRYFDLYRDH